MALRHAAATGKAWAVSALMATVSSNISGAVQSTGAININAPCPEDGGTALHRAVQYGHAEVVECLLGAVGIDASPRDKLGRTPLYLALKLDSSFIREPIVALLSAAPGTVSLGSESDYVML